MLYDEPSSTPFSFGSERRVKGDLEDEARDIGNKLPQRAVADSRRNLKSKRKQPQEKRYCCLNWFSGQN